MTGLTEKVTLITGGGQGLGAAICETLAEAGASVIIADIKFDQAEQVARRLQEQGWEAIALPLDITNDQQLETTVQKIVDQFGRIDVLVNNAGTDVTLPIEELSIADIDRVLNVNLRAPFILAKLVLPLMKQQGHGHIVNIASTAAKRTWSNATAYHASKWGLMGLSHALHVEARPHQVKVTAVVAGGMRTPFILDRFPDTPLEKLQEPKHVAETVRFILTQPEATVIPEVMVLPMQETSWP
ncbi:SDR family oxidoreductase [Pantanalinema rosaneae CENA516]|uniref:SDR family oxidoreductase n=1 Tax=Pantanalinema rosaneae TaxID=1620701 RepID=UPI003D6FDEB6